MILLENGVKHRIISQPEMRKILEQIFNTPLEESFHDEEGLKYLYDLYLMKTKQPPIRKFKTRKKIKKEFWESRKGREHFDLDYLMVYMLDY